MIFFWSLSIMHWWPRRLITASMSGQEFEICMPLASAAVKYARRGDSCYYFKQLNGEKKHTNTRNITPVSQAISLDILQWLWHVSLGNVLKAANGQSNGKKNEISNISSGAGCQIRSNIGPWISSAPEWIHSGWTVDSWNERNEELNWARGDGAPGMAPYW